MLRSEITWLFMRVDSTPSIRWLLRWSTVARTRSENDAVPMDVSVIKGKGGKGKRRQRKRKVRVKRARGRRRRRRTKNKADSKSNPSKFQEVLLL